MLGRVHLSRNENAVRQSIRARMCIVIPSFDSYPIVVAAVTLGIARRSTWLDSANRFIRDGGDRHFFVRDTDDFGEWLWTIHDVDSCRVQASKH